jgi:hypothetical protein
MNPQSGPKTKIFKSQYNYLCNAALVAEMNSVAMVAGEGNLNVVEVTENGISLQPGPGDALYMNTYNIKTPMAERAGYFELLLPGATRLGHHTPDIPFLLEMGPLVGIVNAFSRLV